MSSLLSAYKMWLQQRHQLWSTQICPVSRQVTLFAMSTQCQHRESMRYTSFRRDWCFFHGYKACWLKLQSMAGCRTNQHAIEAWNYSLAGASPMARHQNLDKIQSLLPRVEMQTDSPALHNRTPCGQSARDNKRFKNTTLSLGSVIKCLDCHH